MSEQDINRTIENLCSDLKPVKPQSPLWRSLLWITIAISYVVAIDNMVGVRPQMIEHLRDDEHYMFEILLALLTGISASIVTFFLTVPEDGYQRSWMLPVPATLFAVHVLWMLVRFTHEDIGDVPIGWFSHCWMDSLLMAGLPGMLALIFIRRGATVRPFWLAFNAVLAVSAFGWIGIRFTCPFDTVGKAYFVNFLPFLVFGLVIGFAAKKLFRW